MASKYTGTTNHAFLKLPNEVLGRYNSFDSWFTARLVEPLFAELQRRPAQWKYYLDWVEPLQYAVIDMQRRGLLVDKEALRRYRLELRRELRETDDAIRVVADEHSYSYTDKFPNSDKQVRGFLFGCLGLKPAGKTDGGAWSVDQENLARVLRDLRKKDEPYRVPVLHNLFHRSRLQTIYERYLSFPTDPDGRVRARVKMTGTKTGRFAYEDPPLQQYPKEARHVFPATPGRVLLSVDYSQLEARILAILAGDQPSLDTFLSGGDVHAANARDLFGWTEQAWQELEADRRAAARNFAKAFLYGLSYGGKTETMKTKTYCPCAKCADKVPPTVDLKREALKTAELRWFRAHPAVKKFQSTLAEDAQYKHYYDSPFGPRRWLSEPWGSALERELKNIPEQMNAALLMNRSQVKLHRLGVPIALQMHDEFLVETEASPGSHVDQTVADIQGTMEEAVPELGGYSFPTDAAVGENWGVYHSERNPNGLRDTG